MSSKRGKDGESPAKTLTSSTTKRVRRDETTATQDASVMTPTASTAVASSTSHGDSPHATNADDKPELIVDYNESTPSSSPMDDEDSECIWHGGGSVDPITDAQTARVHNASDVAVTLQPINNKKFHVELATISSTITKESAILEGSAAFLSVNVSSERQDIHNGKSDFDEPEHKAPTDTGPPSVLQARRLDDAMHLLLSHLCLVQPNGQWRMGLLHRF